MLTTSQTRLEAVYCEDAGILCVQCMFKETGFDDRESLIFWMASQPGVSPIIEYSLDDYADAGGLYCDRCGTELVAPYCPECGGTLVGCNEGTGERDRDGFLLCAGCCTKLEDESGPA